MNAREAIKEIVSELQSVTDSKRTVSTKKLCDTVMAIVVTGKGKISDSTIKRLGL